MGVMFHIYKRSGSFQFMYLYCLLVKCKSVILHPLIILIITLNSQRHEKISFSLPEFKVTKIKCHFTFEGC